MATLYQRGNMLWLKWRVPGEKKPRYKSTGLDASQWSKALALKTTIERELKAAAALGVVLPAEKTVGAWRRKWIEGRKAQGIASASDDEARLKHASDLDPLPILDVRPRHIRDVILRLRREGELAPRTIRHVAGLLRRMFEDARIDELIPSNPYGLKRGDLPGKEDKDEAWRATAIYVRQEVELLISDPKVPEDRRTLYGLLFLSGCRVGELADRRFRDWDDAREPLGCLHVHSSFHTKTRSSKSTKTRRARQVPVHLTLKRILEAWRDGGWERMMGRKPELEDLLIPTALGRERTSNHVRNKLLADLARLGLRARRTHDTRRTFISLCLADGARKDILRWVTHGPSGDIMDLYTTVPWTTLCDEVSKLKVFGAQRVTARLQVVAASAPNGGDTDA
jgi:integrase